MLGTMQSYAGNIRKGLSSIMHSTRRYLTGYTYELVTAEDPDKVIFTTFVEEARKKGVGEFFIGIRGIAEIKFYMFVDPDDPNTTIAQVANYGDPQARAPFKPLSDLLAGTFVVNLTDPKEVQEERKNIRKIINAPGIFELAHKAFEKKFSDWDKEKSINDQIDAVCIEIVTKVLYKISLTPEETEALVESVEEAEKVVFDAHKIPKDEYEQIVKKFTKLNNELTEKYIEEIKAAGDTYYERMHKSSPEKEAKDLNLFKLLIVAGNITALLKGMMVVLAQKDNNFLEKLKEDEEFLDRFYLEGLRYFSPQGPLVRESSLPGQVGNYKISTNSKLISFLRSFLPEEIKSKIPANAIMIVPLGSILHDPKYWEDPEVFDPNRKELDPSEPNYHPLNSYPFLSFSRGLRTCPASTSFVKNMTKAALLSLAEYNLSLTDEGRLQLEPMDPLAKVPRLYCKYFAELKREPQSYAKNENENENEVSKSENVRLSRSA